MSESACCAHSRVSRFNNHHPDGTTTDIWWCNDCKTRFVPMFNFDALRSQLDEARAELAETRAAMADSLARWRTWGTIEVAIRNPNVASYIEHWEKRALSAEADRDALRAALREIFNVGPLGVDTYAACWKRMHDIADKALHDPPAAAAAPERKPGWYNRATGEPTLPDPYDEREPVAAPEAGPKFRWFCNICKKPMVEAPDVGYGPAMKLDCKCYDAPEAGQVYCPRCHDYECVCVQQSIAPEGDIKVSSIWRFTAYRRNISQRDTHTALQKNADSEPQFEGVIWTDGTVTLRWLTACRSTSVWASIGDCLNIHGHPEYGTEIIWHDAPAPPEWIAQVSAAAKPATPEKEGET